MIRTLLIISSLATVNAAIGVIDWSTSGTVLPGTAVSATNFLQINLLADANNDAKSVQYTLDKNAFDCSALAEADITYLFADTCAAAAVESAAAGHLTKTGLIIDQTNCVLTFGTHGSNAVLKVSKCHALKITANLKIKDGEKACKASSVSVLGNSAALTTSHLTASTSANTVANSAVASGLATGNGAAFCKLCADVKGAKIAKNTGCLCSNATATGAATSAYCFHATKDQKCTRTGKGTDPTVANALDIFACADFATAAAASNTAGLAVASLMAALAMRKMV